MTSDLTTKLREIKKTHRRSVRRRVARTTLGSSVIRVFNPGTKDDLLQALDRLDLDGLARVQTLDAYDRWFRRALNAVSRAIEKKNRNNERILPGLKWGHATKVLCIFVREIALHSRYLKPSVVDRIERFLYVPIDSVVMNALKELGQALPFARIKDIESPADFYRVQSLLGDAACEAGVPRVWFDDVWAER